MKHNFDNIVSLQALQDKGADLGSNAANPEHVLAMREIVLGINLRGLPIPQDVRERIAITLNIDLGLED